MNKQLVISMDPANNNKNKGDQTMTNQSLSANANTYNLLQNPAKLAQILTALENTEGKYLAYDTGLDFFNPLYSDFKSAMKAACAHFSTDTAALLPESFRSTAFHKSEAQMQKDLLKFFQDLDKTVADLDFHFQDSASISLENGGLIISYRFTQVYNFTYTEESGRKPESKSNTKTFQTIIRKLTSHGFSQYQNLDTLGSIARKRKSSGLEMKQVLEKEYLPAFKELWNDPTCTESMEEICRETGSDT